MVNNMYKRLILMMMVVVLGIGVGCSKYDPRNPMYFNNIEDVYLKRALQKYTREELIAITKLKLKSGRISDISALVNLKNLTSLTIQGSQIYGNKIKNIDVLINLKNLTHLELSGKNISNISILGKLTNLKALLFIRKKGLRFLKALYIFYNKIQFSTFRPFHRPFHPYRRA